MESLSKKPKEYNWVIVPENCPFSLCEIYVHHISFIIATFYKMFNYFSRFFSICLVAKYFPSLTLISLIYVLQELHFNGLFHVVISLSHIEV